MPLTVKTNHESGFIPPGASVVVGVVDTETGRDGAPDTGYHWEIYHTPINGGERQLNSRELSALCDSQVLHTFDRRDFNFKLRSDTRGIFRLTLSSSHGVGGAWRWEIAEEQVVFSTPTVQVIHEVRKVNERLDRLEAGVGKLLEHAGLKEWQ